MEDTDVEYPTKERLIMKDIVKEDDGIIKTNHEKATPEHEKRRLWGISVTIKTRMKGGQPKQPRRYS